MYVRLKAQCEDAAESKNALEESLALYKNMGEILFGPHACQTSILTLHSARAHAAEQRSLDFKQKCVE